MDNLLMYMASINGNDEVRQWLVTTGKKALTTNKSNLEEMEHIIDYLCSEAAPTRLRKMSYKDAKRKSQAWSTANQKKGRNLTDSIHDIETVHDFLDGSKIVKLKTKQALQREGYLMSHCVGGYDVGTKGLMIYSYRDSNNMPHVTFEVRTDNNEITQIKGKGNGSIHPKYIHPVLAFLKTVGMDIRPGDMKNLGYYYVNDEQLELLKLYNGVTDNIVVLAGKSYAYE